MTLPIDPDTWLVRDATAAALTEAGFPVAPATLATKASRGGGPPFQRFGRRPIYRWGDAIGWARSQLGPVVSSTAELDALSPGRTQARSNTKAEPPLHGQTCQRSRHRGARGEESQP